MAGNAINDADLELAPLNSRFADANTEETYRAWSIEDRMPAMLLGGWVAIAAWGGTTLLAYGFFPDSALPALKLTFGLVVPWVLAVLLIGHLGILRPQTMLAVSATMCMTGFASVHIGLIFTGSAAGICGGLMINILYAPFMRITAGWAVLALSPSIGYGVYLIIQSVDRGELTPFAAWFYCGLPVISLLTVGFVNLMHDRRSRCIYRDQRIIERQKASLERVQGQIRRYMPPAVAEQIIAGNEASIAEPKRQRVTVLFSDIVGFTDIADRVEPEVMTQVINEYMAAMSELIDAHQGTVNEFIGDGLMALFGAPDALDPETQAQQAIISAQAMQAKLPELNQHWRKLGLGEALQIRIGINTGMVSVGSYGSEGRMTYTAIGLQTNIAARIQSHCEPGGILISEASCHLVEDHIDCVPKGEVECKGVHFPVKVYAPSKSLTGNA
ncbi:MAG: adenylate/guanylate cyclase domain-containing protein [Salinisphaeraceae bacterium]|nr:adenylate/guanylate cyclase domain-containing protein [Salinisphaeraceae bacterium]